MDLEGNLGRYTMFSSEVDAVCDWFGPTDLLVIDSCRGSSFGAPGQTPEEVLIGAKKTDNRSKFILANPVTFIDPTDPPFLIFHGDADFVVPYCESALLNHALQSAGVQSEYVQVPGGQHYTGTHTAANIAKMVDFFNNVSGNDVTGLMPRSGENELHVTYNAQHAGIRIQGIDHAAMLQYDIVDLTGRVIDRKLLSSDEIELSSLNKGVYILKLFLRNDHEITMKFVKS